MNARVPERGHDLFSGRVPRKVAAASAGGAQLAARPGQALEHLDARAGLRGRGRRHQPGRAAANYCNIA